MVRAPGISALIDRLRQVFIKEKALPRIKRNKPGRTRVNYSLPERNAMVILRHGSLVDFSKSLHRFQDIAKAFHTTYHVVR